MKVSTKLAEQVAHPVPGLFPSPLSAEPLVKLIVDATDAQLPPPTALRCSYGTIAKPIRP